MAPATPDPFQPCLARFVAAGGYPPVALHGLLGALLETAAAKPETVADFLTAPYRRDPAAMAHYEDVAEGLVAALERLRSLHPRADELPDQLERILAGGFFWTLREALERGEDPRDLRPTLLWLWLTELLDEATAARLRPRLTGRP